MTKVKICGMTSMEDIRIVNKVLPDYIGFVFAQSKRKVTKEQAKKMKQLLDSRIKVVGVFVNEPIPSLIALCKEKIIDLVQLHGEESLDYLHELQSEISQPIIYARRVRGRDEDKNGDFAYLDYPVDYFLFDAYQEGSFGGTGTLIDYKQLPTCKKPLILAGGLNPENVQSLIQRVHPYCVDVSSGVEVDGHKDEQRVRAFVKKVRATSVN